MMALSVCALWPQHAMAAQTAEQAVEDVDAAFEPSPREAAQESKKLFHRNKPKKSETKKSSSKSSRDFYEAHKSDPNKAKAAVKSDDLMKAMRQDLEPDAPMLVQPPAPAAETKTKTETPAPEQQVIQPIPSGKLFHRSENAPDDQLPPVVPKAEPAPVTAPVVEDVKKEAEEVKKDSPPVKEEPVKDIQVKDNAAKEGPKKEEKTGAPLLTDLSDAPDGVQEAKPAAEKPNIEARVEKAAPATQPAPVAVDVEQKPEPDKKPEANTPGFAKPRPLFSSQNDKRKRPGISKTKHSSAIVPSPDITGQESAVTAIPEMLLPLPEKPAVKEQAQAEPMIKPVEAAKMDVPPQPEKKSIWGAPTPEMNKGRVLFSQNADGQTITPPQHDVPAQTDKAAGTVISSQTASATPEQDQGTAANDNPSPSSSSEPVSEPSSAETPEAGEVQTSKAVPPVPTAMPEPVHEQRVTTSTYNPSAGGVVHGSCGAVNGVGLVAKPISNLCTQGTPSAVVGKGPWNWSCSGSNGGTTVKCSAYIQVNGECGPANGSLSASPPPGKLCASGKATGITGNGPWYWSCFGDNGGVTAQCVAYTLVSGVCGPAHNVAVANAPVTGLCASGHETAVLGDGPWSWNCTGSGENTTVNCMAPVLREGVCGEANGVGTSSAPRSGLCASGTASALSGNGPWSWMCSGENGGASVSCSAPASVNAVCGPAHGIGVNTAPSQGLCVSGSASMVSGSGPWMWTCNGENGGAMVNCMAPKKVDGICGPAHQNGSQDAPQAGLCNSGTATPVSGTGPWQWSCQGAGGGITSACISQPLVHAGCGSAHGVSVMAPPTNNLCASGVATTVIGSGPFMWSCQGANGGSAVNCMAPLQVNGACGAADGIAANAPPGTNLCRSGNASAVSGNGPFIWTCSGANGGISTTCQAPLATQQAEPAVAAVVPEVQIPSATSKAGNECTPSVKRWTITCQQGGYPSNYTGVIVGETQTLCPTGVERGVWLSNSCAAATDSAPVSPSPGKLQIPPSPGMAPKMPPKISHTSPSVTEMLPDIAPMPVKQLNVPKGPDGKLFTPRYKGGQAAVHADTSAPASSTDNNTLVFAPSSEGLEAGAVSTLDEMIEELRGNDKSIITLNAYAATPGDGNQQEARRLALARALAVRSYLMRKGLPSSRIDVRAVGPASDNLGDDRVDIKIKTF